MTKKKKIELMKYQTLMWIDIWKNKLDRKKYSKYYFRIKHYYHKCVFCGIFQKECIKCFLLKHDKNGGYCCRSYLEWFYRNNSHAAAHIAWVSRKYYRLIGGTEL